MEHKKEFGLALIEFLLTIEMLPLFEAFKQVEAGSYQHFVFMKTFNKDGDDTPYRLLAPTKNWLAFLNEVDTIFASKINRSLLQRTIDEVLSEIKEFPFTEEMVVNYQETIFATLWEHYQLQLEALVALQNITFEEDNEVRLGNCMLCAGHKDSIFAQKANHPDITKIFSIKEDSCFLRIQVSGDGESRLRQIDLEVERSLAVLRFVTMWGSKTQGTKRIKYNRALRVDTREKGARYILYHELGNDNQRPSAFTDVITPLFIQKSDIETAKMFGLEVINYHFANSENPLSRRIIRALELYDSGVRALNNWQALYRYVASINVVLPTQEQSGTEIKNDLQSLITYGGSYLGTLKKDGITAITRETWAQSVQNTSAPFKNFYSLRSQILHGNLRLGNISDENKDEARELAHNAIRLMASLAQEFNWQSDEEAKKWFETPKFPPSIGKQRPKSGLKALPSLLKRKRPTIFTYLRKVK